MFGEKPVVVAVDAVAVLVFLRSEHKVGAVFPVFRGLLRGPTLFDFPFALTSRRLTSALANADGRGKKRRLSLPPKQRR